MLQDFQKAKREVGMRIKGGGGSSIKRIKGGGYERNKGGGVAGMKDMKGVEYERNTRGRGQA